jgi:TRAP transporter 4TM/12TM fusion protein
MAKAEITAATAKDDDTGPLVAEGVDEEVIEYNRRLYSGWVYWAVAAALAIYAFFHIAALNGLSIRNMTGGALNIPFLPRLPMESWTYRTVHIAGACALGFLMFSGTSFVDRVETGRDRLFRLVAIALMLPAVFSLGVTFWFQSLIASGTSWNGMDQTIRFNEIYLFGYPLLAATFGAIVLSWFYRCPRDRVNLADVVLVIAAMAVASYLITIYNTPIRATTGTSFAPIGISLAGLAGTALILELTRRVTGLALPIIAGVFLVYVWLGHLAPGVLNSPRIALQRFFSQVYTDVGILGQTTAVSSTYIILFIIFAAFLQASKVGEYFINFAFAMTGRQRGGPAKVAIFASGLMGMINGTSAGNVVATGSLTIPLMHKVGYDKRTSGAIEAAASTGGQIMPPIMGAGAFIMAEITGIPYQEIAIAALIPSILYFASVYFMVDLSAARIGMKGMRADELPKLAAMMRQVFLFLPIIILIAALFAGYSVIRAGTYATAAAAVVSWLTPYRMGPKSIAYAFQIAGSMSIQIIAVCACAGIIVGVISLTGVGARFSNLLLGLAGVSQLLAMFFAMVIAILLGMGMPTTAAYAVAASVVAPGLIRLGIDPLTAHFFVFYFAVVSAITPPVALASYAAAGISGADPMQTSFASFKIGLAAFIVPFMFFYNGALLMNAPWLDIAQSLVTALIGVFFLASSVQAWLWGKAAGTLVRIGLLVAALFMISGGWVTDLLGLGLGVAMVFLNKGLDAGAPPLVQGRAD